MNTNDVPKLSEEDIVRLARTMNRNLPQGFENSLMARVEHIDRRKRPKPSESPNSGLHLEPDIEEEIEP